MKLSISFFFLCAPVLLYGQLPLEELSLREGGGNVSRFVEISVQADETGLFTISYLGIGQRTPQKVKDYDGAVFKFENFTEIWVYLEDQNYQFVLEVPTSPKRKEAGHLGNYLWRKKE